MGVIASLQMPTHLATACNDFVWRVWELALELGASSEDQQATDVDADAVLTTLQARAAELGDPMLLLAECALHRYFVPFKSRSAVAFATASQHAASIIETLHATDVEPHVDSSEHRVESLSFFFFDQLVRQFVRPLNPTSVEKTLELLAERAKERQKLRQHCRAEAEALLSDVTSVTPLQSRVTDALRSMRDSAEALVEADRTTMQALFTKLREDPKVWAAIIALGGPAVGMPAVQLPAAVTALTLLGTHALTARREGKERVSESPLSLVYYASH